jgi:hypothetical protein
MHRKKRVVWPDESGQPKGKHFDGYYLLWAIEPLTEAAARVDATPEDAAPAAGLSPGRP